MKSEILSSKRDSKGNFPKEALLGFKLYAFCLFLSLSIFFLSRFFSFLEFSVIYWIRYNFPILCYLLFNVFEIIHLLLYNLWFEILSSKNLFHFLIISYSIFVLTFLDSSSFYLYIFEIFFLLNSILSYLYSFYSRFYFIFEFFFL